MSGLVDSRLLMRAGVLAAAATVLMLMWCGLAAAATTISAWAPVALPSSATWTAYDVYAFGSLSLAVTGDGGHVAVTRNAGATWKDVVAGGLSGTTFTAIALDGTGHGAVASGGLMLVTADGGTTWSPPVYVGPAPGSAINDIALRGSKAVAVGDDGMIMSSDDAGATWSRSESPTRNTLTSVAIAGDGTAVAGAASGEILVETGGVWAAAGTAAGPVTSVTASANPTWGDGMPDLIAAGAADVVGSDDAQVFETLPGLPAATTQPWSRVAWTGVPTGSLLIAGSQGAGFFDVVSQEWVAGLSGLGAAARAVTPAGQSVAYLLGTDGSLVRTLSAGRDPATEKLGRTSLTKGQSTRLTSTVQIGAPGKLLLRSRMPGHSWGTQGSVTWNIGDWDRKVSFKLKPSLTHEYSLSFRYGSTTVELTPPVTLVVAPQIKTSRARYDLRRGQIFRFSGSVGPKLSGESVQLYTDRGGKWRPVSLQRSVKLRDGRTWVSRQFGTPKAEKYHLRAHMKSTKKHAAAWSRIVTVSIR